MLKEAIKWLLASTFILMYLTVRLNEMLIRTGLEDRVRRQYRPETDIKYFNLFTSFVSLVRVICLFCRFLCSRFEQCRDNFLTQTLVTALNLPTVQVKT